jgi:hypothetical protein
MQIEKNRILIVLILTILSLAACRGAANVDPQVQLKTRVDGFIMARQARDQIALQGFYLNPGEARLGNIIYKGSEILAININEEGNSAQVKLKNSMQAMGFTFKNTPQTTNWVRKKGDWYLVVNSSNNPFNKSGKSTK